MVGLVNISYNILLKDIEIGGMKHSMELLVVLGPLLQLRVPITLTRRLFLNLF